MSEALEKFKAEYIDCCPEFSTEEVLAAGNAIESAWNAALEQTSTAEPVAWCWDHLGMHVTTDRERTRQMIADGVDLQPLYTAPPSTAEIRAQALEEAGESMCEHFREQRLDMTFALAVKEGLYQRAKRIREEG